MPEAGWYEDSGQPGQLRWWDGAQWTADTTPMPPAVFPPPDPAVPPPAVPPPDLIGPARGDFATVLPELGPPQAPGRPSADRGSSDPTAAAAPVLPPSVLRRPGSPVPPTSPTGDRRRPVLIAVATVIVVAVVATVLGLTLGRGGSPARRTAVTTPPTAPDVTTPPSRPAPTTTTVPGAADEFETAVQSGSHPVTGYRAEPGALLRFGRSACDLLRTRSPVVVAWYATVAPGPGGTSPVQPVPGAYFVADAERYLCPSAAIGARTRRLVDRVGVLQGALTGGGVPASAIEAGTGVTAYACQLLVTGSSPGDVRRGIAAALEHKKYALSPTASTEAATIGIGTVCPAHLPAWSRAVGKGGA